MPRYSIEPKYNKIIVPLSSLLFAIIFISEISWSYLLHTQGRNVSAEVVRKLTVKDGVGSRSIFESSHHLLLIKGEEYTLILQKPYYTKQKVSVRWLPKKTKHAIVLDQNNEYGLYDLLGGARGIFLKVSSGIFTMMAVFLLFVNVYERLNTLLGK